MEENEETLNRYAPLRAVAQDLTGVAFSLWRAVFLSDTTGEFADQFVDARKFLISLISDNTILYATDKSARNWSFRYYLDNAAQRLARLNDYGYLIVDPRDIEIEAGAEKDEWLNAQRALSKAIERFETEIARAGAKSVGDL